MWKSFRSKVLLARQLSLREWLTLVEAWWVLFGFYLALRWLGYDRLETIIRPAPGIITVLPNALAWARQKQSLVSKAARLHLLSMTCLPRALTLRWMLGRHGIPAQLRIGMNKTSTGIHAHAWVDIEDEAIGESEDIAERFKILLRFS